LNITSIEPILQRLQAPAQRRMRKQRMAYTRSLCGRPVLAATLLVASMGVVQRAAAQVYGSDSHTVTVTVATINVIQVSAGSVSLTITGAGVVAGQDQMSVVDQSTSLLWGTNSSNRKITVSTNLVGALFTLRLVALNPTQGTAMPEVVLSTVANDLLVNVGRTSGSCMLRYTGVALASQGTGTDSHTVTFTISN